MRKYLPPWSDEIFKRLFGDARHTNDILLPFLRAVRPLEGDDYDELELIDPFVRSRPEEKTSILDVQAKTKRGRLIDIEIQMLEHTAFRHRIVYYAAKLVSGQLRPGDHYDQLKQVFCLAITGFTMFPQLVDYHIRWRLQHDEANLVFSDLIEIHTLELPKLPATPPEGPAPLWDWLKFLQAEEESEMEMLEQRNPDVKKAIVRLAELSDDEAAQMRFEAHLKWQRDMWAREDDAEARGMQRGMEKGWGEGLEKGLAQGRDEGIGIGLHKVARRMLEQGRSIAEIMDATGLSELEVVMIEAQSATFH